MIVVLDLESDLGQQVDSIIEVKAADQLTANQQNAIKNPPSVYA